MGQYTKYAFVGLVGYFIGFYEMKTKVQQALLEVLTAEDEKSE